VRLEPPARREAAEQVPHDELPEKVLVLPHEEAIKGFLERMLVPHRVVGDRLEITRGGYALLRGLGQGAMPINSVLAP
jgi:hypothetical protein